MRLAGKVSVITGAGSGFGKAAALLFSKEGSRVVALDIREDRVRETADAIKNGGGDVVAVVGDVRRAADAERMIKVAVDSYGGLDVLVANAGVWSSQAMDVMPEEEWDWIINTNLKGAWLSAKYAIPELRKRGGGSIIFTGSVSSLSGSNHNGAYAASKGGVLLLCKSLAKQMGKDRIRANCVCPGPAPTRIWGDQMDLADLERNMVPRIPSGRLCGVDDVARAMLYLASDDSAYVNGTSLLVDGAYLA